MSKADANIKVGADITAFTTQMADAFWNLRHLRRGLRDARVYVQAQNGQRTVLVRRDASAETWTKAERFLTK